MVTKKTFYLNALFMLFLGLSYGQDHKIDSTFNFHFKQMKAYAVALQPDSSRNYEQDSIAFSKMSVNEMILEGEKDYLSLFFLEEITGILAPRKQILAEALIPYVNMELINKWQNWYKENKPKLEWATFPITNTIKAEQRNAFAVLNFDSFYPYQIKFKGSRTEKNEVRK